MYLTHPGPLILSANFRSMHGFINIYIKSNQLINISEILQYYELLNIPLFAKACYICKKYLFSAISK